MGGIRIVEVEAEESQYRFEHLCTLKALGRLVVRLRVLAAFPVALLPVVHVVNVLAPVTVLEVVAGIVVVLPPPQHLTEVVLVVMVIQSVMMEIVFRLVAAHEI